MPPEPSSKSWEIARNMARVSSWAAQDVEAVAYIVDAAYRKGRDEMVARVEEAERRVAELERELAAVRLL